ncbi:protein of unknown function [Methylocaldum szegediense]|uniref:Secreted protein n=1 Tax=Methylocaldum szegediense TaxID=73780 RepID=A0ABN8X350_9GAMM|nr:protein of unknown function [Methylocaldum szegediense]
MSRLHTLPRKLHSTLVSLTAVFCVALQALKARRQTANTEAKARTDARCAERSEDWFILVTFGLSEWLGKNLIPKEPLNKPPLVQ